MPGISVNDNGTVKTVTGLYVNDNGTVKPVVEAYVNDGGTVKKFWPSIGPPAAVTNLAVTGSSGNTLDLAWSLPADNGSPITTQTLWYGTDGVNFPLSESVAANATTATLTGLSSSTLYYVRHNSANAQGTSPYSNVAQGTTLSASFPQAPTLTNTTNSGSGILTISVNIARGGGGIPTQYEYQYAPYPYTDFSASQFVAYATANQGLTISVPNHASSYAVRVRAINGAGTSPWSNLAHGVSPGPMVNGGSFSPVTDEADTGAFKDIVYAINDVANGGNGQVLGSASPTSVNGLTLERMGRTGNQTFGIRLVGSNVQANNFKFITIGNQGSAYNFTLDTANATFTPGQGTAGTLNTWNWGNIPLNFIGEVIPGASLSWWVGGPT